MSLSLVLSQRTRENPVDLRRLRKVVSVLLTMLPRRAVGEIGICLLDAPEMARINETYLRHAGSTDVISFDYAEPGPQQGLAGEIFVCLPEARKQARRFRVTWQRELLRYVVHGLLHLCGFDDRTRAERSRMKREENRLLRRLDSRFALDKLALCRPAEPAEGASRRAPQLKRAAPQRRPQNPYPRTPERQASGHHG